MSIGGTVSAVPSEMGIRWDSGHDLNGYEYERFQLRALPPPQPGGTIPLVVTRTASRNPASEGGKVVLRSIFIDDRRYIPAQEELAPGIELRDDSLVFVEDGAELRLQVSPASSVRLEFPAFNRAGMVNVGIGDDTALYDLYAPHQESQWAGRYAKLVNAWFVDRQGRFTVSMPMPRYGIKALRVESNNDFSLSVQKIKTADGQTLNLKGFEYRDKGINFPMETIDERLKRRFHPHRLVLQIIFALVSTWLLVSLGTFAGRFKGLKDIFLHERRYLFWFMLLTSCLLFLFWHLSFWPGITSNDSLEVWRAAQIPGMYLGDHPPLNVIFYLYLSQFWNDVAIVPLVQNFLTSLLIAHILFSLYRTGLPFYGLLPCFALLALSLPVGLYTTILWKDVPFALITVLLGYRLAVLYFDKRHNRLHISTKEWIVLFGLTLALAGFRHNGILYLFIVPLIIVLFGLIRVRPLVLGVMGALLVVLGMFVALSPTGSKTAGFLAAQTRTYVAQAANKFSLQYVERSGKKYFSIFDVNQKDMQWDLVHFCMFGRYGNDFLRNVRWNDVYPFLPIPQDKVIKTLRGGAWALYWKSYEAPWVYLSWNPLYMLILFPLLPFFYRRLPRAAVFSLFMIIPVAVLVFLSIFNWRYYYFAYLASYFLVPLMLADRFAHSGGNGSHG